MKKQTARILMVDDDRAVLHAAQLLLKNYFSQVDWLMEPDEILPTLRKESYDLVLLDMNFAKGSDTGAEGLHWLKRIKAEDPDMAVVMMTAYGDMNLAIQAIKEGASDFVLKPWVNEKLLATVSAAVKSRLLQKEVDQLRTEREVSQRDIRKAFGEIIGQSTAMQEVFRLIAKVAATDANVLILGENGTGKEVVARTLHGLSHRSQQAFIGVDMGAITETLFESELFGHVKGAFTDARDNRPGRFEMAESGTLFLDEIGNLSLPLQAKLLSVLQTRKVVRVGSNKETPVNIRLICATNRPIHQMVTEGDFRQDLHYRINTIEINLPPLRERHGDIPLLSKHYLQMYGKKYGKAQLTISPAAMRRMEDYSWPGNIRELQHSIERAVILCNGTMLEADDFFFPSAIKKALSGDLVLDDYNLENAEKMIILRALEKAQGNISRSAQHLGLTRAALYRRMEKYGL